MAVKEVFRTTGTAVKDGCLTTGAAGYEQKLEVFTTLGAL
jgi:hypothetical protein